MAGRRELEQRRAALLARSAAQRAQLESTGAALTDIARRADGALAKLRRFVTRPVVIVLGVAAVVIVARTRPLRSASKAVGMASAAWRAGALAMALAGRLRPRMTGSIGGGGAIRPRGNLVGENNVGKESQGRRVR
jgi:hypothetical protein